AVSLFEYVLPGVVDCGVIVAILLVEFLLKPAIDIHRLLGFHWQGKGFRFYDTVAASGKAVEPKPGLRRPSQFANGGGAAVHARRCTISRLLSKSLRGFGSFARTNS